MEDQSVTMQGLMSLTPDQLAGLQNAIAQIHASKLNGNNSQYVQSPMRKKIKGSAAKRAKTAKGGVKPAEVSLAAKRPLNSWMAFRAFYSPAFNNFQQKDISGFLNRLWKADAFKAKWAIVAKAYSIIRDQVGKPAAPLNVFLQLVYEPIGLIAADKYLSMLGWVTPMPGDKQMIRAYDVDTNQFSSHLRTTNLSADDVVQFCHENGFGVFDRKSGNEINQVNLTMSSGNNVVGSGNMLMNDNDYMETPQATAPLLDFETNNMLLAETGDQYPYNSQFDPQDATAGFGLFVDVNDGDDFNSFDVNTPLDFDGKMDYGYNDLSGSFMGNM